MQEPEWSLGSGVEIDCVGASFSGRTCEQNGWKTWGWHDGFFFDATLTWAAAVVVLPLDGYFAENQIRPPCGRFCIHRMETSAKLGSAFW